MFYISRNTLAITPTMTKKAALAMWTAEKNRADLMPGVYQLCKETCRVNPVVIMDLN